MNNDYYIFWDNKKNDIFDINKTDNNRIIQYDYNNIVLIIIIYVFLFNDGWRINNKVAK